jgi:orotidine-5'-phosphate decarboxylase
MAEVILALDLPGDAARRLIDRIPGLRWVKVGSILFAREGPALVRDLTARGLQVFLDLKWHDIPNTVAGAVDAARELRVAMASVHTLGGAAMLEAAQTAANDEVGLVGITVLTSHSAESYGVATGRAGVVPLDEVRRLAETAARAGLRGIVCSPQEVSAVRGMLPPPSWIVVPGIRRDQDAAGDQTRTADPAAAARAGASHLVVGRPILQAADPAAVFREFTAAARSPVPSTGRPDTALG